MTESYDMIVIGAGSGGVSCARRAALLGAKTAIIESNEVGGTCVIRGCVPKKLTWYASQFSKIPELAKGYGWSFSKPIFDWPKFVESRHHEVSRLSQIYIGMLKKAGVTLIKGRASFKSAHQISVGNKIISGKHIVIAIGNEGILPDISGANHAMTSRQLFECETQPKHIVIIGGGYIGVEFAAILKELGSNVTLVIRRDLVLRGFDEMIREAVQSNLQESGVQICINSEVSRISKSKKDYDIHLQTNCNPIKTSQITADAILFAIGRKPDFGPLGLDDMGVKTAHGLVSIDKNYATSVPHIYALGDCANHKNLTPVAIAEGRDLSEKLFGKKRRIIDYDTIPTAIFSVPEAGTVGLSEDVALEAYPNDIICYQSQFKPLKYTLTDINKKSVVKLVVQKSTN
ncbi:MAG: FAD-dependent oxidoreductase, partial [Candidatus Margulisbacteria bacterium]|nr:FAD-dependent oxidoreductase [Candidatus Margulisiibacteriota bacterium]